MFDSNAVVLVTQISTENRFNIKFTILKRTILSIYKVSLVEILSSAEGALAMEWTSALSLYPLSNPKESVHEI